MHTSRLPASLSKAGRRLGSAKRAEYSALFEARFRLYQRRFLRPRPHFSAFFKLYIFSFAPFQISVIFQAFAPFFTNLAKFLQMFKENSRFCTFSSNFNGFIPEFRRISAIFRKKPEKKPSTRLLGVRLFSKKAATLCLRPGSQGRG